MKNFNEYLKTSTKDKRLGKRTVKVLEQIAENPDKSINQACGGKGQSKAAYRLFANENFDDASIVAVQKKQAIEKAKEEKTSVVLIAEDTTTISYNGLKETKGIGPIDENPKSLGILVHSALGITEKGQPLGLLAQKKWFRDKEDFGKRHDAKKNQLKTKRATNGSKL